MICSNGFTLIINSIGYEDDGSIRIYWTGPTSQPDALVRARITPKWPYFRELAPITTVQLNNPLAANSKKSLLHKLFIVKVLQKAENL